MKSILNAVTSLWLWVVGGSVGIVVLVGLVGFSVANPVAAGIIVALVFTLFCAIYQADYKS